MIPQSFITDLLARADIVEIVGRYVQLKKAGSNYKGLCPFHGEKTPSFTVSATKQFYHCFGCGAHGTAISFLMEHAGLSFVDAVKDLAGMYGLKVPEERGSPQDAARAKEEKDQRTRLIEALTRANDFYRLQLKSSPRAIAYLKGRGVTGRIAAHFGLGYAPDDWRALSAAFHDYDAAELIESGLVVAKDGAAGGREPGSDATPVPQRAVQAREDSGASQASGPSPPVKSGADHGGTAASRRYDRLRDRITFPIRNTRGEIIGFGGRVLDRGEPKYLNSPETPVFHKGEELYGLFEARQSIRERGHVIVVEGYMDVVALAQHGFANAVATLGTACTPMHVQKLFRHTDAVVFSFDGDAAGRRAARRALEAALPHAADTRTVRFLFLPPEHDPDSFVRELGSDAFERALANAMPLSTFFLQAIAEGCALGTAEGRAQAVANAKPLLTQLPDGALRLQLLQSVAELARIELRELKRLVYGKGGTFNGQPAAAARAAPVRRAALSAHERAVVSLLAHPAAWHRLETAQQQLLTEGEGPAGMLAQWLATLVERDGLDPAAGIAALQSALDSGRLPAGTERYARQALLESAETGTADALAAVAQLERLMLAEQAKRLAQGGLATAAERETYRELQARLRNLRAMTPSGV